MLLNNLTHGSVTPECFHILVVSHISRLQNFKIPHLHVLLVTLGLHVIIPGVSDCYFERNVWRTTGLPVQSNENVFKFFLCYFGQEDFTFTNEGVKS